MRRETDAPRSRDRPKRSWKRVLVTVTKELANDYCPLPRMIRHPEVEKACLQRTVQADIGGAVNAMPGNPIDVTIAVSVSGVP